ncbi:hypothetical protein SDC9_134263 [bioreactor metagenome]|uniref:Uncharacterized protein n=1 Tax=bioreactor metagenome TaxID=1076179 RepID=A0A645DD60_9ZZZZ
MKLGASFTAVTVIVKVTESAVSSPPLAVPPLSLNTTVTVVLPLALAAGVKVKVPVIGSMLGCVENNALLLLVTVKLKTCPASSAGPFDRSVAQFATVCAPASSFTVTFAPAVKLGTSFTAVTVIVKVTVSAVLSPPLSVPPLSLNTTVTVALPLAFAAGV